MRNQCGRSTGSTAGESVTRRRRTGIVTSEASDRSRSRWALWTAVAAALIVAACNNNSADDEMELDLDTMEAETPFGTLEADRVDASFVGPLDEGQAIGIACLEDVGVRDVDRRQQEIVVYVYERESLALMIGRLDATGAATLESLPLSDFDATVDLMMNDDVVSGDVSLNGGPAVPFVADRANGVGGVYWAQGTDQEPQVSADWVVLPDERQWGCVCIPPSFASPCCRMGRALF
jgi:hypothetical protein